MDVSSAFEDPATYSDAEAETHTKLQSLYLSKKLRTMPTPSSTRDLAALASPHNPPSPRLALVHEANLATVVSRIVQLEEQLRSQAPPQYEPVEALLG
jgi:hypothetical protein